MKSGVRRRSASSSSKSKSLKAGDVDVCVIYWIQLSPQQVCIQELPPWLACENTGDLADMQR